MTTKDPAARSIEAIRADLLSGLTVAMIGLPQSLAYAMMSGLPPVYGIATAAVTGFVAALAGKSAQVATGPTNATGLLILSALLPFLGPNGLLAAGGLPALALLTLMAGLARLVVVVVGGASLVRFLPESVLVGFTAGAGILIGVMQLDEALGLPPVRSVGLRGEIEAIAELVGGGVYPTVPAVLTTLAVVAVVWVGKKRFPLLPVPLLAVIGSGLFAWLLSWSGAEGLPLVSDRSPVPKGWPETALPAMDAALVRQFLLPTAAIVLLGTLELAVSARAHGARPDMRREIAAQGLANVVGAFSGAFPASASFTRSTLLRVSGARTRLAAASSGLFVVPILLFATSSMGYIPQAALAGVLLVIAWGMVDMAAMRRMWRASEVTKLLMGATLAAALVLPLEWAVLLGASLGLVIHLARTSNPRLRLLRPEGERLVPLQADDAPKVVVVQVSGDLHYAAVEPFLAEMERLVPSSARNVVVDLFHAHEVRFTAIRALERVVEDLAKRGVTLALAGVEPELSEILKSCGSRIPATPAEEEPFRSVWKSIGTLTGETRSGPPGV